MTCPHVLNLIDAGPFAEYPRAHLDAAWEHARRCRTCGPALEAATALTGDLAALARPSAPPGLAAAVLARIAQIEQAGMTPAPAVPESTARSSTRDWSAWAMGLGGLAAWLAIVVSTPLRDVALASPRVNWIAAGVLATPSAIPGALCLTGGLVLYVVGLCARVGGRSRP
jgi:hypothetical protein